MTSDFFYYAVDDGWWTEPGQEQDASFVPQSVTPRFFVARTAKKKKKVTGDITFSSRLASGVWGHVDVVSLDGHDLGVIVVPTEGWFGSHALSPDMAWLLRAGAAKADTVPTDVASHSGIRVLALLDASKDPHSLMAVTHTRWFRAVYNPDDLGFAKKEKQ